MRTLLVVACAVAASLAVCASAAVAATPLHDSFTFQDQFVDADTCGFPIVGDMVFTNDITEFSDAAGKPTMLQLHQSTAGTLVAKGTTRRVNIRETIVVEFLDGIPVRSKHVGLLNSIVGPGGPVFLRTGQALFEVVLDPASGFYVDGPTIARHGLRDVFDPVPFCAAFA
jgi:hypothetical protein